MAGKNLSAGALISYGSSLPSATSTPDGALFYKTDSLDGNPAGLYMMGFIRDTNLSSPGFQVSQGWVQAASSASATGSFVQKSGDTMLGTLVVPGNVKITQSTGIQRLIIGPQDGGGTNKPVILESNAGILNIGTGSTWVGNGGILSGSLKINPSDTQHGLQWLGSDVWTGANDGIGSGLDADLFQGQPPSYYLNISNFSSGVLPIARGGTGSQGGQVFSTLYYAAGGTLQYIPPPTSDNQVYLGLTAGPPFWAAQSQLSVGYAASAGSANSASTANTANTATNATNATNSINASVATAAGSLRSGGVNGNFPMTFTYSGQGGQPQWLWGTNDGSNNAVWNPANFSVTYATSANTASTANFASNSANANSISNAVGLQYVWTAPQLFRSNYDTGGGQAPPLIAYTDNGSGAVMGFLRSGIFGLNMGLDSDNVFRIGGWSAAANRMQLDMSGNVTFAGNVTAFSDKRLKKNIELITDPLNKVQQLNGVTFTKIADGERGTGLIAQELKEVLPEAVLTDAEGTLSVAYGNVVGLLVEAIKQLRSEVEELKKR